MFVGDFLIERMFLPTEAEVNYNWPVWGFDEDVASVKIVVDDAVCKKKCTGFQEVSAEFVEMYDAGVNGFLKGCERLSIIGHE